MTDPHLNLFWAFGHKGDDARQLEDNVTRALIVTLRHLGHEATTTTLRRLGISDVPGGEWRYYLHQKAPATASARRLLLGIAPVAGVLTDGTRQTGTDTSILDASLVGDGLHVGVETKITGALDASQVVRHLGGLGQVVSPDQLNGDSAFFVRKTWGDVAGAITEVGVGDPVAHAFLDYLHLLGLSPFRGFTTLDTAAWDSWPNALSQDFLRNRLVALGDAVRVARPDLFGPRCVSGK